MNLSTDERIEIVADISSRILVNMVGNMNARDVDNLQNVTELVPAIAIQFAHSYVEHMNNYVDNANRGAH